jgi:hypothetical protein
MNHTINLSKDIGLGAKSYLSYVTNQECREWCIAQHFNNDYQDVWLIFLCLCCILISFHFIRIKDYKNSLIFIIGAFMFALSFIIRFIYF